MTMTADEILTDLEHRITAGIAALKQKLSETPEQLGHEQNRLRAKITGMVVVHDMLRAYPRAVTTEADIQAVEAFTGTTIDRSLLQHVADDTFTENAHQ